MPQPKMTKEQALIAQERERERQKLEDEELKRAVKSAIARALEPLGFSVYQKPVIMVDRGINGVHSQIGIYIDIEKARTLLR